MGIGKEIAAQLPLAQGQVWQRLKEQLQSIGRDPVQVFEFAHEFLVCRNKCSTLFVTALNYLSQEQLGALVALAVPICQEDGISDTAAGDVLDYVCRPFPELLHPYIETIFEISLQERYGKFEQAWRGLDRARIEIFKTRLLSGKDTEADEQRNHKKEFTISHRLFMCLMNTRDPETILFALQHARTHKITPPWEIDEDYFQRVHLADVGFARKGSALVSIYPNKPYHFIFVRGDGFPQEDPRLKSVLPIQQRFRFGGNATLTPDEPYPFSHILTLDPIPAGVHVTGLPRLVLGAYITEINHYGVCFYQHDANGNPQQKIAPAEFVEVERRYIDYPFRETTVLLAPTPERFACGEWGDPASQFRLGGEPSWIQNPDVPVCPHCGETMEFLLQLDTGLPDTDPDRKDGEVYFGSGGMCYVFWCDTCKVSSYFEQCT
ncbi:MAG: hypothetical protein LBU53_13945 [Zoogloeaceae bacterium]|jgi:hypothetical protein|nr:hypothetical protein [Zoogloeaceae bacterium]